MAKTVKRDNVIAAPIVGAVIAVLVFFVLFSLVGLSDMGGEILGIGMGLFISLMMAAVAGAAIFGELLAQALEGK
jgi:hypothetical protein